MTVLSPSPALRAGIRLDLAARSAADRVATALGDRLARPRRGSVTNEVAPLILIAVIAVAGALALVALIGAVAAWVFYCQSRFGGNYWPAVNWPSQSGGLFYLACKRV
ncbi:MAG: hypothetical protein J0H23_02495 [Micrococcales bacterium]|nr:hypothetical protein [Micrococcales bacterium]OJX66454.1 MAG: hypothetical protein BGO94_06190 [Micrococcales bacterium 72-143]